MAFTPIEDVGTKSSFTPIDQLKPDQSAAVLSNSNHWISNALSTAGAIGGGILGAAGGAALGIETGPGAVGTGYLGGVAGAGAGGAAGEATGEFIESKLGMRPEGVSGAEVAKTGGMMAAGEAILGPIGSAVAKPLSKVASPIISGIGKGLGYLGEKLGAKPVAEAVTEKVVQRPLNVATKRLSSTAETMTKGEREQAIKEGRMTPRGKFTPSATEQRAGEIMKGKTYSNPVKTVKAVRDEISTRGQEAETFLKQNAKPISNEEHASMFAAKRADMAKYSTDAEIKAYDEQVGMFSRLLPGKGSFNTSTYYDALKEYESNVASKLAKGKEALLDPSGVGSARLQGAKDVRSVVRDMIGNKNPEFKGKMYDLASLYDSLDNVVASAEKGGHSLAKRYPKTTAAVTTAAGIAGYEEAKKIPLVGDLLP